MRRWVIYEMVLIEVEKKDLDKVFEILSKNGRFIGLSNNRFRIHEHGNEVLKKLQEAEIKVKVIDDGIE